MNINLDKDEIRRLIKAARDAESRAYAPYSAFRVGAAVMTADGKIYTGCNIENASYPAGLCAERSAMASAISAGEHLFKALAVSGKLQGAEESSRRLVYPCGICRQFLSEFFSPETPLIIAKSETDYRLLALAELLPEGFTAEALEKERH